MFLCSDKLDKYQSMGENGQAVHISALQLRETLRLRKQHVIADTLAIPQINEHGNRIDWYAPFSGAIIPWSAATDSERQAALNQLEVSQAALRQLSEEQSRNTQPEQRLFGQLLEKALQFPDQQHVWLVAGKPVISFWGFVNAQHQSRLDPLDCLRTAAPLIPAATTAATVSIPSATTDVGINASPHPVRRNARRLPVWLCWLLPLLLLLLLALLLLRGCVPGITIPLPGFSMKGPELPAINLNAPELPLASTKTEGTSLTMTELSISSVSGEISTAISANSGSGKPNIPQSGTLLSEGIPPTPAPTTAPESPLSAASETVNTATGTRTPLALPSEAVAQGNTAFLNGRWHAGAGIQDRRTGKPLSLSYQFKGGQGEVRMVRGDGVSCKGAINALMRSGQLTINNQGEAQCTDGSVYQMPEILCTPGAKNIADCKGRYDANTLFPISMKQEASN
ncbi:SrfA family protein [Pectobacterium aroidearum]|uniref:SrfA family protein n=1 Tax=Pectobacterium aroidearum TaxID=1201031 RepID=UPI0032ED5822